MLEWVTALDAERGLKNSLKGYVIKMKAAAFQALVVVVLALHLKPVFRRQYPFFRLPCGFIAFYSLLDKQRDGLQTETLSDEENLELRRIARKTWRYYEEFVNRRNNYLAPDNFQEDPPNGIAYRRPQPILDWVCLQLSQPETGLYRNFGAL